MIRHFLSKKCPAGEYRPITYRTLKSDIDCLGTYFARGGDERQKDSCYWRKQLPVGRRVSGSCQRYRVSLCRWIKNCHLMRSTIFWCVSEVDAILFSAKMEDKTLDALEGISGVDLRIRMNGVSIDPDVKSWETVMEEGRNALLEGCRQFMDAVIDPDVMCALLFTSGTTGNSKGVMLSHRNIAANVYNMSKYVKIRQTGRRSCRYCLCTILYETDLPRVYRTVPGYGYRYLSGPDRYVQQNLKESKATVMVGVPAVFEMMHKKVWKQAESSGSAGKMTYYDESGEKDPYCLTISNGCERSLSRSIRAIGNHMELFIAGGAAINPQVIRDYEALGIPMIQGYGMTENAPIIAVNRDYYSKAESVGPPMPGTEVRIFEPDEEGVGEIICKGPSVMLGYYKDPEATAEVLKDGWLYTGDFGRFDEDGFLYICGRKKNVIVTKNGKNIFPEEIEYLLLEQPYIEEVIVYGVLEKKSGDTVVTAEVYPNFDAIHEKFGADLLAGADPRYHQRKCGNSQR